MINAFLSKNKYVNFSRGQIQDKEGQLKRDYRMLKEARKQSGASWNEKRQMVEGSSSMWDNLQTSFPKIAKLYDGHLAEGKYNCTSLREQEEPLKQIVDVEDETQDLNDVVVLGEHMDDGQAGSKNELLASREEEPEGSSAARLLRQEKKLAATEKKESKEEKRPKKGTRMENIMEMYLDMRAKQVEGENALLAKEKETAQGKKKETAQADDFTIKRCVLVLDTMEVTKVDKVRAYGVFKSKENREIFLSACSTDQEAGLMWLRNEMA